MYPDGFGVWAWHGVQVPEQAIMRPDTLTGERILTEPNVEVRRAVIEALGYERFTALVKPKIIDEDIFGKLLRIELEDDEPLVAIHVTCPSTNRSYLLRVPPEMRSAQVAVAWTFDVPVEEYQPKKET